MKMLRAILLALVFMIPTTLQAQASGGETSNLAPAPVPGPTGTAEKRGEQGRHSDDLGQSSTALVTQVETYDQLVAALRETRAANRVRVEKVVEQERVREAWEIGRLIDIHVLQHKERAGYDKQVIARLAADLGMSASELYRMLEFYRAYPIFARAQKLSWSHFEALLAVNDPEKRNALAERAEKENWSRDRLREEVKALKMSESSTKNGKPVAIEKISPVPHSGSLDTYKITLAATGPYTGELALDLGFSNYVRLADLMDDTTPFKEGDVVAFLKEESEIHKSREEELYTYRAWIERVLDGDTVKAVVDLGFGFTTRQTLRLRGIDAPELPTRDGTEAKEFLESLLLNPGGKKNSVFIKTSKSDKYDRYLVDVFITDKSGEDQYLNNLLLEKGYAVRVRD